MKLVFVHRKNTDNLGDFECCPGNYLEFGSNKIECRELKGKTTSGELVVIGGGGLFHPCFHSRLLKWITQNKIIFWGIGSNTHKKKFEPYPDFARHDNVILSGTRDFKSHDRDFYVPCASCLSPIFSTINASESNGLVVYEHKDRPIPLDLPKRSNDRRKNDFSQVIEFLADSEGVITNSFHGVYWSLLLGKRVALFRPFSTRFHSFPFEVPVCTASDHLEVLANAVPQPWFLDDCRQRNHLFHEVILREVIQ